MSATAREGSLTATRLALIHAPDSPLVDIVRSCTRIAPSDATVLITGETGTGKEVFARLLHERSPRAGRPLVPVNCGAIPEALLESELFGHVKGAFTGAVAARRGRIAAAEGGTLFLDEVGELPLSLQVKLLRVLQERCYEPVGSTEPVPANFRLVAATNRDLRAEVEAGRFRRDLYYRLLVCPVEIPALRERPSDVSHLFAHFWAARGESRPVEPALLELLERHSWPGNVRELENLVERLSVCTEGPVIRPADLPPPFRSLHVLGASPGRVAAAPVGAVARALAGAAAAGGPAEGTGVPYLADVDRAAAVLAASLPAAASGAAGPRGLPFPGGGLAGGLDASALAAAILSGANEPAGAGHPAADGGGLRPLSELVVPLAMAGSPAPLDIRGPIDLPAMLRRLEDAYIDAALARTRGNKKAAADLLGLQRTTLVEKLRRRARDAAPTA
jgi:sigma-54 specific flagellar transcriptional regulator A